MTNFQEEIQKNSGRNPKTFRKKSKTKSGRNPKFIWNCCKICVILYWALIYGNDKPLLLRLGTLI